MEVGDRIFPLIGQVPAVPAVPMVVDGVEFRLSLLSTREDPYLATQIAFVASEGMDGGMLECGTTVESSPPVLETVTLQIGSSSEFMQVKSLRAGMEYISASLQKVDCSFNKV